MDNPDKSELQSTLADAELIAVSEEVSSYFPRPISDTLITLMEVDPYTIHAYWNIEPSRIESILDSLRDDAPEGSLTLRVHTTLTNSQHSGNGFFDSEIQGMQSSIYVNVMPQTPYFAEIGLLRPDGDFFVLAKSNEVVSPPDYKIHRGSMNDNKENIAPPERQEAKTTAEVTSDDLLDASLTNSDETDSSVPLSVSPLESKERSDTVNFSAQPVGVFYTGGESSEELEVNVEIRVFGRVKPGTRPTIAGEKVTIRPDGSFNHRISIKDKEDIVSLLKIKHDG
ncbi:MAG: DUF4912 domain-containing protein [Deltaproteobacteria bacterium]|nr:DUF4912 domain-containing protein [Deltaproteobacteria bacterium]